MAVVGAQIWLLRVLYLLEAARSLSREDCYSAEVHHSGEVEVWRGVGHL